MKVVKMIDVIEIPNLHGGSVRRYMLPTIPELSS